MAAFLSSAFVAGIQSGKLGVALRAGAVAAATVVAFEFAGAFVQQLPGGKQLASGGFGAGFGTTAHIVKIASHAGIGCVSAVASGGKCGAGALSAGVSAGATPFYATGSDAGNVAMAAAVGGVASKLGGGSFSDGTATAAFGYLFNQAISRRGRMAEDAVDRLLAAHDARVVGREISYYAVDADGNPVTRADGSRLQGRMDFLVDDPNGRSGSRGSGSVTYDEVKDGPRAQFTSNQKALLPYVHTGDIVFYGGNAERAGIAGMTASQYAGNQWGGIRVHAGGGSPAGNFIDGWVGRSARTGRGSAD